MITFGTSGWRAVMGEEFTFQNVRTVVQAIANYLKKKFPGKKISVVVDYDTRFLSERYAFEAAKVLSHNQIHVFLTDRDAPSQALAFQVIKRKAQGGINFTASFNPPEYNGLKYNTETGAPAMPEETDKIEEEIKSLKNERPVCPYYPRSEFVEKIDLQDDYLAFIQDKIDFEKIRKSKIKIAVDLLYGASREYLDEILEENHIPVEEIHGYVDPYFGGITPSCSEENLEELKVLVREKGCHLGIATDADGDRFGIVDEKGNFIIQNLIISLLLDYLVSTKNWKGGVARSVATTHLVDRIARKHDFPLYKTPVGFKYLADLFLKNKIFFGGEESACMAIKDHLPEKDGIFAGLLVAEMMASSGKSLSELIDNLFRKYGKRVGWRKSVPLTVDSERKLRKITENPPKKFGERKVLNIETIDGLKLDFSDDDWLLIRHSGTEPLMRYYAESSTKDEVKRLIDLGMELVS
ncbi:MAG: phosphoglucomutase/phosphomannomutase family protein [Candidatus Aminicenantes bacterium]|nr:MAG: phosphoglucomutase/phosphomannomutase family protein [Candidatus Aminicenantes bacterium]